MIEPPLTWIVAPVIQSASLEARKLTTAAISSGLPSRPIGIWRARSCFLCGVSPASMSVSTGPGATALTVTLYLQSSCAAALVNPTIPAFEAAYSAPWLVPLNQIWLEMLMTRPQPFFLRWGRAALVQQKTLERFVARRLFHSSGERLSRTVLS